MLSRSKFAFAEFDSANAFAEFDSAKASDVPIGRDAGLCVAQRGLAPSTTRSLRCRQPCWIDVFLNVRYCSMD